MARASIRFHSQDTCSLTSALSINAGGEPASSPNLIIRQRKRNRESPVNKEQKNGVYQHQQQQLSPTKTGLASETKFPVAFATRTPFGMSLALGSNITDWKNCDLLYPLNSNTTATTSNATNTYESKLYSDPFSHWLQFSVHRRRREHSIFSPNPFCGLQESSVTCTTCGYASTNYTKFLHLSLPVER